MTEIALSLKANKLARSLSSAGSGLDSIHKKLAAHKDVDTDTLEYRGSKKNALAFSTVNDVDLVLFAKGQGYMLDVDLDRALDFDGEFSLACKSDADVLAAVTALNSVEGILDSNTTYICPTEAFVDHNRSGYASLARSNSDLFLAVSDTDVFFFIGRPDVAKNTSGSDRGTVFRTKGPSCIVYVPD